MLPNTAVRVCLAGHATQLPVAVLNQSHTAQTQEGVDVVHETHAALLVDPAGAYLPSSHVVHAAAPAVEYVSTGHCAHAVTVVAAVAAEYVPAGHCVHVADDVAPAVPE